MTNREGWAVLPIDKGSEAEVARALLALADDPRHVVWVPGKLEFEVPDDLAERYRKSLNPRPRRAKKENGNG